MRRRNTAAAAVAGVAAVAVLIGTPVAVMAGRQTAPPPGPATTDTATTGVEWRTRVPDTFPLGEGLPSGDGITGGEVTTAPGTVDLSLCGSTFWSVDAPVPTVDARGVQITADLEATEGRTVALYQDQLEATRAYEAIRRALTSCEVDRTGSGFAQAYQVVPLDLGTEESFAFAQYSVENGGTPIGDLTTWQVARTGNAVYLASASGQGGADEQRITESLDRMTEQSAGVRSDLCVFAADPCPDPSADGDGVDLTAMCGTGSDAWPADRRTGSPTPWPARSAADARADDVPSTARPPRCSSRCATRCRLLGGHAAAATPRLDRARREVVTGQDSVTFAMNRSDGSLGGMIYQLTRVGNAVIATSRSSESSTTTVAPGAVEVTDTNAPVVEEMLAAFGD